MRFLKFTNPTRTSAVWLAFLLMSACAQVPRPPATQDDENWALGRDYLAHVKKDAVNAGGLVSENEQGEAEEIKPEITIGSGQFVNKAAANRHQRVVTKRGEITFNFEGEELQKIIHLILGKILKENYIIAPGVKGKVTFATAKPISKDQVLPILEMLLSWNNAALVWVDDAWQVVPKSKAIQGNLTPKVGSPADARGYTVLAVPLRYIAPSEMEKILKPFARDKAILKADNARRLLMLAGTRHELENYLQTINTFDVDWIKGMSVGIFPLQKVEATQVAQELEVLFGEGADNPLAGMFRFMPIDRLNAVMVITPQPDYLYKARDWIQKLDRTGSDAAANLYVYNVENIKATDLAGYLNDIFGNGSASGSRQSRKESGGRLAPGLTGRNLGAQSRNGRNSTNKQSKAKTNRSRQSGQSGVGSATLMNGDVRITAIEESNQLLISASAQQYDAILSAIKKLDTEPLQVLIEAKILEVSLTDKLEYGLQWYFGQHVPEGGASGSSSLSNLRTDGASIGSAFGYTLKGGEILAELAGSDLLSHSTVLSTPSVMVMNNKSATINVGKEIPVISGNTVGTGGTVSNYTQYKSTGVILEVTPRVNPGGLVYLEINQEVSSPGEPIPNQPNLPINKKQMTSEVAVRSGETIVMGGLISENTGNSSRGTPLLSRLPVVGGLFGSKSKNKSRTELILLLTPTVINNRDESRELTREYSRQFIGLKPLRLKELRRQRQEQRKALRRLDPVKGERSPKDTPADKAGSSQ